MIGFRIADGGTPQSMENDDLDSGMLSQLTSI